MPKVRAQRYTRKPCLWPFHDFEKFVRLPHAEDGLEEVIVAVLCETCGLTPAEAMIELEDGSSP